jgi:ABC-type multidrug transport system ATPase subunit
VTRAAVAADGVAFAFGNLGIVEDLTVGLQAGDLSAFVGPNGSGKTTVLELLAGLRAPDAGTVSHRGDAERSVAYLPQSPRFRSGFTARETVALYADLVSEDAEPLAPLERVGLADAADRPVEALSGGMTRLLGLAQALVGDPPVVVLDEPTSGLDPEMADRIFAVIADITADGRAVVVASHDVANVEAHADRVLFLADGGLLLDGTPAAICEETGRETLRTAFFAAVGRDDGGGA